MGLFDKRDKKRKDDFDSPVEQVDLSRERSGPIAKTTPPPAPGSPAAKEAAAREAAAAAAKAASATPVPGPVTPPPAAASTPTPTPTPAAAPAPAAEAAPRPAARREPMPAPDADDYGIERAIELMRTLPSENVELVVQVVKFSLESVGIKLPTIIEDATRRQRDIQGKIASRKAEIADLEEEIRVRKDEIERLEEDHRETTMVRERLELAEHIGPGKKKAAAEARDSSAYSALEVKTEAKDARDAKEKENGKTESAPAGGRPPRSHTTPPPSLAPLAPNKK